MVYVSLKSGVCSSDITSRAYIFISFEAIEMDDPSSADELTETDGAPMGQPNLASRSIADAIVPYQASNNNAVQSHRPS